METRDRKEGGGGGGGGIKEMRASGEAFPVFTKHYCRGEARGGAFSPADRHAAPKDPLFHSSGQKRSYRRLPQAAH